MVKMNPKTSGPNGLQFGLSGDSTNGGGISRLAEFTAVDSNLLKLLGVKQNTTTTATVNNINKNNNNNNNNPNTNNYSGKSKNGHPAPPPSVESSVKRNPEEIAKQLQAVSEKRRPLLSSQETIESYKSQILELKLKLHQLREARGRELENFNVDDDRQDLIAELMDQNASLKRQLEEIKRKKEERTKNARCQTNLDLINMEDLLKASITLKRQKEQELCNINHQISTHQQHQQQKQQHQERTNQIQYATISNKQLALDEKELLEKLYIVDGCMTTILDKLRAISNTH